MGDFGNANWAPWVTINSSIICIMRKITTPSITLARLLVGMRVLPDQMLLPSAQENFDEDP